MCTDNDIANLLFPDVTLLPEDLYRRYPPRQKNAAARITRFAPSPTGFLTIGGLYATLISERLAHQSGGVFYLRIEDTDQKREVAGSAEDIIDSMEYIGIRADEGVMGSEAEIGDYGPYKQSSRAEDSPAIRRATRAILPGTRAMSGIS
ncbi:Glutamyl-Q tRNA(Asp) synthetase [Paenibacillus solanacearum]|uniref:Glutamyl-Q tRNA(Asp) synthetase n=1 Tax=Paenibacillus solanacearum TaxID=2048548 RepID=A0A916JTR9_9BACL|nr:glutamate--tRNA ligase family protein [Paenibacillus solanacearum]CAG7600320.1 Glutamyl-Q tRNA(Asp) synthetase [Paenibacillus solanacearum]